MCMRRPLSFNKRKGGSLQRVSGVRFEWFDAESPSLVSLRDKHLWDP